MARGFNGTSDKILMSLGLVPTAPTGFTLAAIVRLQAVSRFNNIITLATSADAIVVDLTVTSSNELMTESGGARATVTGIGTGYQLLAITKAAGNTAPKGHRYVYSTGAWTHTAAGATDGDPSGTVARPYLAAAGTVDFLSGDIEAAGVWNRALSDAEIELLPYTMQAWYASNPVAGWKLDQGATTHKILDFTGGGANENTLTGTTIASTSVPTFNYSDGIWLPTHSAAAGGGTVTVNGVAGTLTLGGVAPTPGVALDQTNASLVLGGTAPSLVESSTLTTTAPSLALSGVAPSLVESSALTAPAGVLVLGGTAPVITDALSVSHTAGSLLLAGTAPTLTVGLAGTAGILNLRGGTHTLSGSSSGYVKHSYYGALFLLQKKRGRHLQIETHRRSREP